MLKRFWPYLLIALVGLLHRLVLFLEIYPHFHELIAMNRDWLTMQYLSADVLSNELGLALLYLQQTPPIPHLIMGVALKLKFLPLKAKLCVFVV